MRIALLALLEIRVPPIGYGGTELIAGNARQEDQAFFEQYVLPEMGNETAWYLDEVDQEQKHDLLPRARCLLAPITWEEPFGLFMAEANACGTPMVAFNRVAAPEVIRHGETGFVVDNVDGMVAALSRIDSIDPAICRAHAQREFIVTKDYLNIYARITAQRQRRPETLRTS